jgi:L-fuculose-phosphate aldolase
MERDERQLREAMAEGFARLRAEGLGPTTAASLGVRLGAGLLVTPADVGAGALGPHDIVRLDAEGCFAAEHRPTAEWRLHHGLLQGRPDVDCVLQCQSPAATALACAERPLPAFHPRVALAGGHDVPLAPYAAFATADLAATVLAHLDGRRACLMARHGLVVLARRIAEAVSLAADLEALADSYLRILAAGEPAPVPPAEMDAALAKFARLRDGLDPLD